MNGHDGSVYLRKIAYRLDSGKEITPPEYAEYMASELRILAKQYALWVPSGNTDSDSTFGDKTPKT